MSRNIETISQLINDSSCNCRQYHVIPHYFEQCHMDDFFPPCSNQLKLMDNIKSQNIGLTNYKVSTKPETDDHKRYHLTFDADTIKTSHNRLQQMAEHIDKDISGCLRKYNKVKGSGLLSLSGCNRQAWHYDYHNDAGHADKAFFLIVAVQANTKLNLLINNKTVIVKLKNIGDLFIGRGTCIHAGSAYKSDHLRMHFYVDPTDLSVRNEGDTYWFVNDRKLKNDDPYTTALNKIKHCKSHIVSCKKFTKNKKDMKAKRARCGKRMPSVN